MKLLLAVAATAGCFALSATPSRAELFHKLHAAHDDEFCQSIGAKPGTSLYVQCRLERDEQRQAGARAAFGTYMMNRPKTCYTSGFGNVLTTHCY